MAATLAGSTLNLALNRNRDAGSLHGIVEADFDLGLLIGAPLWASPRLRTSTVPEELAKDISEILNPAGRSVDVAKIDAKPTGVTPPRTGLSEPAKTHIGDAIHPPEGVVLLALLVV